MYHPPNLSFLVMGGLFIGLSVSISLFSNCPIHFPSTLSNPINSDPANPYPAPFLDFH